MGQLTMIPICGSYEIEQLCFFRLGLSSFVQKCRVDENASFDNCAAWACFSTTYAEGGLARAQIARKTG